ncbi:MAG: alanine racemase [Mailhella sp.]|nr:alanine racemase [Mailhella sp.]MBQ9105679.1 alanine racemase [Mailhella sp.]
MKYTELDTPSLLIDRAILESNLRFMQDYANAQGVALRPHTKTHKIPVIALMQAELGAAGIAVAKVGEAEVMAEHGLRDILIANEIAGEAKLRRIRALSESGVDIVFGVDCPEQVEAADRVFAGASVPAQVSIEIEVGEERSGIIEEADFHALLDCIAACHNVRLRGLFSHDGNSYSAPDIEACHAIATAAMERTVHFAKIAEERGMKPAVVSFGSTPSLMHGFDIVPGITELRPGTYALMDASQANVIGTRERCAATVLATVMSRPTAERVILDVGAKGLTMQERTQGICSAPGKGVILEWPSVHIHAVYDEHAIIYNREFREGTRIGDKVRIIPVHICPVCNLYDKAYLIDGDEVTAKLEISCRGRMR